MNMSNEFLRLMAAHQDLALATSVDNTPHVRIVNFVYAEEKKSSTSLPFQTMQKLVKSMQTIQFRSPRSRMTEERHTSVPSALLQRASAVSLTLPIDSQQRFRATTKQLLRSVTHSLSTRSHFPLRQ